MMKNYTAIALLAFGLAGCSSLSSMNPFASSGPKMTELQKFNATATARLAWQASVGKGDSATFTPAVVGSSVYAAGKDGSLMRVDAGQTVWKINAGQTLSGGVGADDKIVVVGTPKGNLLAYASADGNLLWSAKATSEILSPPVIAAGLVVVRSGDNRLAAYNAQDGKRKWIYQRPTPALSLRVTAPPIIDGGFVFAGFPGGKLVAVDLEKGLATWDGTVALPKGSSELDRVADITSSPVIVGRTICAVAFQGRVACFDLGNGTLVWARDISSAVGLALDSRHVYITDDKSVVYSLDLASGATLWKQDKLLLRRVTAPLPLLTLIAVADAQGVVHFLDREDGSFVARLSTDGSPVLAPPKAEGSNFVVQTNKGGVYAIEVQ